MRATIDDGTHPQFGYALELGFLEIRPVILELPLVAQRAIESLDVGILLRLAGLDVIDADVPLSYCLN